MLWASLSHGQEHSWPWASAAISNDVVQYRAVAVDKASGSSYAAGDLQNSSLLSLVGVSLLAQNQALLSKFDDAGANIWTAVIGGTGVETGESVAIAPDGSIYITGTFTGTCYFYNQGGIFSAGSVNSAGSTDIYLAKYSAGGSYQWSVSVGNSQADQSPLVAADANAVYLHGCFRGHLSVGGSPSSMALNSSARNLLLARFSHAGALLGTITGGSISDDRSASIAVDGSRIVIGYSAGASTVQWYAGNSALGAVTGSSTDDHHYACFSTGIAPTLVWGTHVHDPNSSLVGYPNVALGCEGAYITGAAGNGSAMINGSTATASMGSAVSYVARLDLNTGATVWCQWITGSVPGSFALARDIAVGRNGTVHVVGSFEGQVQLGSHVLSEVDDEEAFLITLRPTGLPALSNALPGADDQIAWGVDADGLGRVMICGSFENGISIPGAALTGPSSANGFVAAAQAGSRGPAIANPALFSAPNSVCANAGPIDLNTWMIAPVSGYAIALPTPGSVSSPAAMLNAPDGTGTSVPAGTSFEVDFGTVVPAGEGIVMRWRRNSFSAAAAALNASSSIDAANWTAHSNSYTTLSDSYILTHLLLPSDTRIIRFVSPASSGGMFIDGFMYQYGTLAGGGWSGAGVSGTTWTPPVAGGTVNITYTYGSGSCTYTHSRSILVNPAPGGGTISGGGIVCPNTTGTLTLSGHTGSIVRWQWTDDGTIWNNTAESGSIFTWSGLIAPRRYRVELSAPPCSNGFSSVIQVTPADMAPPVFDNCPANSTLGNDANSCTHLYAFPTIESTDNCDQDTESDYRTWHSADGGNSWSEVTGQGNILLAIGEHLFREQHRDDSGNTAECNWSVTIVDQEAPSIICPLYDEYPLILNGPGCSLVFPDLRDSLTVNDCSIWTNSMSPAPGTVFTQDSLVQMTMWIVDDHGNGVWNNHTIRISGQTADTTIIAACSSYTWPVNGSSYSASGTYTHVVGCHTETLDLTITPSTSNSTSTSACNSYFWAVNGQTHSVSGTYTHVVGCHTETLDLTINVPGNSCDDGNPNTGNDVLNSSCNCIGQVIDCEGTPGGTAYLDNCNSCVGGITGLSPCTMDCNGVWGGTAYIDNCTNCVGGSTGLSPCTMDCNGVWGGTAYIDNCTNCVGGSTGLSPCTMDCNGVWGGTAYI
ncbi:MAG TPA: hypothetical protein PKY96_15080, partial [Flavobacteriales bacterium]|nr:hypothetical protein [Flavobacteriales bacterium]